MATIRRYGLSAKIRPGVELRKITITLHPYDPPVVELSGTCVTGNRRVDASSSATVKTMHLGEAGVAFIETMKAAFGGTPAPRRELLTSGTKSE